MIKKLSLFVILVILAVAVYAPNGVKAVLCTTNFPASLDTYVAGNCIPSATINNLETKVGINGSIVTSSLDYLSSHPTSPFTIGGSASSSLTGDASNSIIQKLNTIFYIPTDFAANGCFASSTLKDFGGCVNYAYSLANASSVTIVVPTIKVTQAQWKTPIVFATNQVIPSLICPGGAQLGYGGTNAAVQFNFNVSGAHDVSQDWGCTYLGSSTVISAGVGNSATTTGIIIGGTTGANAGNGIHFHDNIINGFGSCMDVASNTYMISLTNNAFSGCGSSANQPYPGSLLTFNTANNSGEREIVSGNSFTDPANSTATNAIYMSDNGNNSTFFTHNSFDDVSVYVGISQAIVDFDSNHWENSSPANYSGYYFIIASSSGATTVNVQNNLFAIDSNSAASQSKGIEEAVNFSFNHNEVNRYGNQGPILNFINHDINPGQAVEEACNNWSQNSSVSNWMQLTGVTYPGCFYEVFNSYPILITTTGGNLGTIINGQQTVGTFDSNGNWGFLNKLNAGSLTTATTTLQTAGSFGGANNVVSVSSTLTATSPLFQTFTGAAVATATLPRVNVSQGQMISFKNRGTATLSITASSTDFVWLSGSNASATTYSLLPGSSTAFQNDGTYWDQLWK